MDTKKQNEIHGCDQCGDQCALCKGPALGAISLNLQNIGQEGRDNPANDRNERAGHDCRDEYRQLVARYFGFGARHIAARRIAWRHAA